MNIEDITEILKLFEKRINKLEQKVVTLEGQLEDQQNKQTDISQDNISVSTIPYNKQGKIIFTKEDIFAKKGMVPEPVVEGFKSISKSETMLDESQLTESLEEGEIYEPLKSPSSATTPGRTTQQLKSKSLDIYSPRTMHNKPRSRIVEIAPVPEKEKSGRKGRRARSKSDITDSTPTFKPHSSEQKAPSPPAKTELHYGLMVEFPHET